MTKLLQFQDIKKFISAGKDEFMFLKNLMVEEDESEQHPPPRNYAKENKNKKRKNESEEEDEPR